jgi:flagellum-specific peptidoglycan hydrolase FlgJ
MKQSLHPISRDLRALLYGYYQQLQQKINSPWTKAFVLLLLFVLFTRQELSFSLHINGGSLLGASPSLTAVGPSGPAASASNVSQLVSKPVAAKPKSAPARKWTAKETRQLAYVKQYRKIAQEEMRNNGVPASITLAQGLLESNTGKSGLATRNNNHFGIKCFSKSCKKGHCSNYSDDSHKDFFLKYDSPEKSYRDHSRLLKKDRYKALFKLKPTNYRGWARGLSKAGYATDPKYADKLIGIINNLDLTQYDQLP